MGHDRSIERVIRLMRNTVFTSRSTAIILIAVLYVVAAKLSFLFTIPPGNISPVFPSAGIALAAVLILGRQALIGVTLTHT